MSQIPYISKNLVQTYYPQTLKEWYGWVWKQPLPDIDARAPLWAELGLGSEEEYAGAYMQNLELLAALYKKAGL